MRKRLLTLALVLAALLALTQVYLAQTGGSIDLGLRVLGSGGTTASSGASTVLGGTLGQFATGASSSGNATLQTGYWQGQGEDDPTVVILSSFSAVWEGTAVRVRWETASEVDLLGFNLHRAMTPVGPRTQLNDKLIPAKAQGPLTGAKYDWLDETVTPGQPYAYWLEAVDADSRSTFYGPVVALPECEWQIFLPVIRRQHLEP